MRAGALALHKALQYLAFVTGAKTPRKCQVRARRIDGPQLLAETGPDNQVARHLIWNLHHTRASGKTLGVVPELGKPDEKLPGCRF